MCRIHCAYDSRERSVVANPSYYYQRLEQLKPTDTFDVWLRSQYLVRTRIS